MKHTKEIGSMTHTLVKIYTVETSGESELRNYIKAEMLRLEF